MSNAVLAAPVLDRDAEPPRGPDSVTQPRAITAREIGLRGATAEDAPFVAWLTRATMEAYVRQTWGDEAAVERYFAKNCAMVDETKIIQLGGRDVGRLTVQVHPEDIFVDDIHVHPDFQGRGVGAAVLGLVADTARASWRAVRLQCLRANPAVGLCRRLGFLEERRDETHFFMRLPPGARIVR